MASVALGIFDNRDQAERSVQELRNKGFDREISVVARDEKQGESSGLSMRSDTDSTWTGSPPEVCWEAWPAWPSGQAPCSSPASAP